MHFNAIIMLVLHCYLQIVEGQFEFLKPVLISTDLKNNFSERG